MATARTAATTIAGTYGGRAEPGALHRRLVRLQYTVSMVPNSNMQSHHMMTAGSPHMPTANPAGAIALISLAPSPLDRANASNAIMPEAQQCEEHGLQHSEERVAYGGGNDIGYELCQGADQHPWGGNVTTSHVFDADCEPT